MTNLPHRTGRHRHSLLLISCPGLLPATYTVIGTTGPSGEPLPAVAVRLHASVARTCDRGLTTEGAAWRVHVEAVTTAEAMAKGAARVRGR